MIPPLDRRGFLRGSAAAALAAGALEDTPLRSKEPRTAVFPETLQYARQVGFAGPPGRRATEALSKFILVDMFAKSIQGMPPEDAVKWADGELKRIYGA